MIHRRQFILLALAAGAARPVWADASPAIREFSFHASEAALADLDTRLTAVRWPEPATQPGWEQGPPLEAMQALVAAWRDDYDWRATEARLNGWPQFVTEIDGLDIHFLHVRSSRANATPMILTHGWPSSILLFEEVIGPLSDPTAHGGAAGDAFHLVIPSLPGFGFSGKPTGPGWNAERTASAWIELMRRLGYDGYVAQGGDWGAYVTTAMAQARPDGLRAIHLNFAQTIPNEIPETLTPEEARALEVVARWETDGFAYFQLQATRPQLAGYLLTDSPTAQAAWLLDIFNGGSGDTGAPERVLGMGHMLDEITMFWLTGSAGSSARFYREQVALLGSSRNPGVVEIPVGVTKFPHDLPMAVRSWADAVYPRLIYWSEPDRGGHFVQFEAPDLFVAELRKFGAALRDL